MLLLTLLSLALIGLLVGLLVATFAFATRNNAELGRDLWLLLGAALLLGLIGVLRLLGLLG